MSGESVLKKATTEFTLTVNPCTVTTFEKTNVIGTIQYTLNEPSKTFGPYQFE